MGNKEKKRKEELKKHIGLKVASKEYLELPYRQQILRKNFLDKILEKFRLCRLVQHELLLGRYSKQIDRENDLLYKIGKLESPEDPSRAFNHK